MTRQDWIELAGGFDDLEDEMLFLGGSDGQFDKCIIGICNQYGRPPVVAYDYDAVISVFINEDEMTYEDAIEHFEYNVIGGWLGEYTPVFITCPKSESVSGGEDAPE